eukprot:6192507-Pleurochrysis_carterae.AAC.3
MHVWDVQQSAEANPRTKHCSSRTQPQQFAQLREAPASVDPAQFPSLDQVSSDDTRRLLDAAAAARTGRRRVHRRRAQRRRGRLLTAGSLSRGRSCRSISAGSCWARRCHGRLRPAGRGSGARPQAGLLLALGASRESEMRRQTRRRAEVQRGCGSARSVLP